MIFSVVFAPTFYMTMTLRHKKIMQPDVRGWSFKI